MEGRSGFGAVYKGEEGEGGVGGGGRRWFGGTSHNCLATLHIYDPFFRRRALSLFCLLEEDPATIVLLTVSWEFTASSAVLAMHK